MTPIEPYAVVEDALRLLHEKAMTVFSAGKLHEPVTSDNVTSRADYEVAWAVLKDAENTIRIRMQAEGRDGGDRRTATTDKDWDWD